MKKIPIPTNESERLTALESYSIMGTLPEKEYDAITQLASYICGTPIALVSLLDKERQWFKSSVGLGASETPREISFCQYTIMGDEVYEVTNALENKLFADNPLVTGNPDIRFYAGVPLKDSVGFNLGSLCVIDTVPRTLSTEQKNALKLLANQVVLLLQLRKKNSDLNTSQKEFQNFINLSKDLVCIANVNGMFSKVNPAFSTVLGYSKEELEGSTFVNFVHPDDLDKTYEEVAKLAEGHKTISFENRYRCKNGEYIVLSWNTSPDPVSGNLYCIARDMTKEYKQKEKLVKTSSELSAILNSTDFSIISSDLDGTIKEFNRGAEILLGYKSEEVIGKTSPSIFHLWDEVVKRTNDLSIEFGKDLSPVYDTLVFKARELGIEDSYEWTYVRKDGSLVPIVLSVTGIKNSEGELTGYLGISKDITKEKEIELNLINSNKLLDESQSIAKTGSWKFDLITKDLIWSKGHYKIFEIDELPPDILYEAYRKILRPQDLVLLDKEIEKSVATGQDFEFLNSIEFPDSRVKYILTLGQVVKNEAGEVIGAQGSIQDITEKTLVEQSLINSNKLLDESQSIAKTGSWKFDLITKDLIWSKGHYKIFEIDELAPEILYEAYRKILRPQDLVLLDKEIEKSVATGQDFEFLNSIEFPDNRVKYILTLGEVIKNEAGEVIGAQGSIQDITEKTLVEQSLINSNKLLDESQSIAKIGSWKFDLATDDLVWSKAHYNIFELEELSSDKLFAAYRERIFPDDLEILDNLNHDKLDIDQDFKISYRIVLPGNRLKYILEIGKPIKNEKEQIIGLQGSIMDVTEKTLAELKIAEKAKEINDIRAALDESSIVSIMNKNGVFSFVNDNFCTISKYTKEELVGKDQRIISGDLSPDFTRTIYKTIINGNVWKGEIRNLAKDGTYYWEKTTIVPFLDEKGKPYQYIAISADITDQKSAEENLKVALLNLGKTNKELDQFAYVVSHDLKAPLRAINNLSEWIVEDMPDMPKEVSTNFDLLRGRVMRMENLINGVLDYSRIGRVEIANETIDLKLMLSQIVDSIVPMEGFEITIDGNFPIIVSQGILLQQVFSNLISNAVKYNDKPLGKIGCHYKSVTGFHQFTIKDNGPGIEQEYHEKVFKVFQTIEARDVKESTGIGLSIVKKITEEIGGTIHIESEQNKGCSFIFTMPK
ncbi:PAS domain S-box protein [Flavobacterium sp. LS1P3]|jgi:PAS domain S-box-containing protein|uniref:PAS domain S-box protein n=1 Tax=Flavobacterium sp. LS1P3 TaxID=3401720 RepID=UPI003AAE892D